MAVKVPFAHGAQLRSLPALPLAATNFPGEHAAHTVHECLLTVAVKVPLAHGAQLRSLPALPLAAMNFPGEHSVQFVQVCAFPPLNVFAGQLVQTWSVLLEPFVAINCPGIHVVHFVQVCAFLVVENLPAAQRVAENTHIQLIVVLTSKEIHSIKMDVQCDENMIFVLNYVR